MEITPELIKQRIEIAKDVIASIRTERIFAKSRTYVVLHTEMRIYDLFCDSKDNLQRLQTNDLQTLVKDKVCEVCAIGSLIVSAARLYDKIAVDEVSNLTRVLSPWFNIKELALIEYAFEGEDVGLVGDNRLYSSLKSDIEDDYYENDASPDNVVFRGLAYPTDRDGKPLDGYIEDIYRYEVARCERFYNQYHKPTDRLLAIMENIVRNEGFFIPPKSEPLNFSIDAILGLISHAAENRGLRVGSVHLAYNKETGDLVGAKVTEKD